jgi:hypothetical protein
VVGHMLDHALLAGRAVPLARLADAEEAPPPPDPKGDHLRTKDKCHGSIFHKIIRFPSDKRHASICHELIRNQPPAVLPRRPPVSVLVLLWQFCDL